ncbi:MAG: gamma-glutamyltransferase [Alphaproteobacteria bacterium]|nr:gamma-glutamyltransferase [Alphaproteobacteria bacterium]
MRNLELPGRSPVRALNGMAATSHPLSTMTAIKVLQEGGNAMDAAVAACAVQCVVEPQSTGIGGDCFMLFAPGGEDKILAFNGSGRAPAGADPDWYVKQGITKIDQHTPHAVTVPGAIDAWSRLIADHGTKDLGELLQPAIRFARDGYPVTSRVSVDWASNIETLSHDPSSRSVFLFDGKTLPEGKVHRQTKLAATLQRIAEQGRDGFYTGPVADDLVSRLQEVGGHHTLADFAAAQGEYVTPVRTEYRGNTVYECPPNGQGIVALEILNILSGYDMASMDPLSAERLHLEIEAARLAYGDRDTVVADPDRAQVPIDWMLSDDHATELRDAIIADRAMQDIPPSVLPAHHDTVYLCVVDKDRNAVSFINSLFSAFGSGIMGPESGVMLQNRGCGFVVEPGHPNCIGPNKRPLHTIIPGMVARDGRAVMPFGVMGGQYQAIGHAHVLSNIFDYDMDVQEAIDFPRFLSTPSSRGVDVECGVPASVADRLRDFGHDVEAPAKPIGGGQAIQIDWAEGTLAGGSDPRKDGCALGY